MIKDEVVGLTPDEKILHMAKRHFKQAESWEAESRRNFIFDMKFANGDSDNMWQWPDGIASERKSGDRPCLTINKTMQHCLQVINSQRQNQSQVEVRPVGDDASYEAAKAFEGLVRHIELQSNAQAAYSNSCYSQVLGGIGWWRIVTDFADETSFSQEIYIRRIQDPLSVYLDPNITEADGSDAKYAFIFKDMSREEFENEYPDEAEDIGTLPPFVGSFHDESWNTKDNVRVAEYFYTQMKSDILYSLPDGSTVRESTLKKMDKDAEGSPLYDPNGISNLDRIKAAGLRKREIEVPQIKWCLIAGNKILDKKDWAGKFIPLVRNIGQETVVEKRLDRKGHVRSLIDPQRMYNYWSSSAVEFVALQSKSPYIAAAESIENYENDWENANIDNKAVLLYNAYDESGIKELPAPSRSPPPIMPQAYLEGLKLAGTEMMMVTGQYEANLGQKSNEVSGTAVDARQRQGDNATYHFIDRFSQAIRYTGRILIDLIPKIYDVQRVVKILAEDGTQSTIQIDPNHPQGHTQVQNPEAPDFDPHAISAIFNPNVGEFDVEADIGPAYSTRRQETFHAISQILQQNESLTPVVADILFRAADFPMADELAERLHNMVPKQALGQAPDPQVTQLQQMLATQHTMMMKMQQELDQEKSKAGKNQAQIEIDIYKAETDRIKAVGAIAPNVLVPIFHEWGSQVVGQPINPIIAAHAEEAARLAQAPEAPPSPIAPPAPQGSSND